MIWPSVSPLRILNYTSSTIEDAGIIHVVAGSNSGLTSNGSQIFSQDTNGIAGVSRIW